VYICLQHLDDPLHFTWYEQWASMEEIDVHIKRIQREDLAGSVKRPPGIYHAIAERVQLEWEVIQDADPPRRDWMAPGLTLLVSAWAKPGQEAAFRAFATEFTRDAQAADGCVTFLLHQKLKEPREFLIFQQWRDQAASDGYFTAMVERYGAPRGTSGPDALPRDMGEFLESVAVMPCAVVAQ